jgi:hypothetical protein
MLLLRRKGQKVTVAVPSDRVLVRVVLDYFPLLLANFRLFLVLTVRRSLSYLLEIFAIDRIVPDWILHHLIAEAFFERFRDYPKNLVLLLNVLNLES